MFSAFPSNSDIAGRIRHVLKVPSPEVSHFVGAFFLALRPRRPAPEALARRCARPRSAVPQKVPSWESWKTLVSVWAYHSFSGEVEASNTPTIRRLIPSCRHQLSRIAPRWSAGSRMRQAMAHRDPSSPTPVPTILRYGIAVLSVAMAIGLDFFLLRQFEAILTPFLFAVAATVWYAGTGPGVLAIALSVLSLNYFFLRPGFSFSPISYADLVYLTLCIFCALAVGRVSAVRQRTEQELRQARDELEAKVLERTANLQRNERYLAETQKLTHTGSWAWDARSKTVLYCSEEMFRIYGLDPQVDLPTRKNFRQRVHPEDRNRTDERFVRVVNEKVDSFDEYRVLLPDGTVKHVISSGHPDLDGNGEFIAFIGTATDVTDRKRAEEALRENDAKIRRLVDSNIIGIFIWNFDGRILEANDEFLRMVSYDREDLVSGRIRWAELTPPDWRDSNNARIERQKSTGRFEPFEKEFTRKDG